MSTRGDRNNKGQKPVCAIALSHRFTVYVLTALSAILVYIPGVTNALLADDWPVTTRNMNLALPDILQRFLAPYGGWYRPVFDIFISVCTHIFGLNAVGYHWVVLGIYAVLTVLVGAIAETLTGKKGIGILSSFLFGIHSVHAEPVLWISASNELLAGLFVLLSMKCYIMFRTSKSILHYFLAGACYLLSIATKETAVFLPTMFAVYDLYRLHLRARYRWQTLLPAVPFLLLQVLFVLFRVITGSPYSLSVPPIRIAANVLYYLAVEVFTLPDNYGYLTSLPLWRQGPIVPILAMSVSAFSVGTLIWLYFRFTRPEDWHHLKFACLWSIVALYPVILTATGRTAFMSSIGVIWSISILSLTAWNKVKAQPLLQRLFTAAMILFVVANLGVAWYRAYWWRQAGLTMQSVLSQLEYSVENIPVGSKICITGLPDHFRHAYTFRNAFPSITQRLYPNREIQVILDNGRDNSDTQYECLADVWFHYQGGLLKRSE